MNLQEASGEIIADLMTAMSNCALYDSNHASVKYHSAQVIKDLEPFLEAEGDFSFTILGDNLLANEQRINVKSTHMQGFLKRLRRKGIEKIIFFKGVTPEELLTFIVNMTNPFEEPKATDNISIGMMEIRIAAGGSGFDVESIIDQDIEKVGEVFESLHKFKKLDMVGLEDIVASFVTTLREEANVLKVVSPLKSYSSYTFTHTTNVTILSIFQAQSLGVTGEALHDVGIAALLHDVGKMYVPTEILDKPSKLTDEEWVYMRNHTVYGARYLAAQSDVPKLGVIASYEHHMKFDGKGYPDTKRRDRHQHVVSQIVAIADFFDALRTERPYRKALDVGIIVKFMEESKGTDFNPVLVDNFIRTLKEIGAFKPAAAAQAEKK